MEVRFPYAAGLIDGEGTITLSRLHASDRFRAPAVSISSTSRELLLYMQENFGGLIITHKTYQKHHKAHWSWRMKQHAAIEFLRSIAPFLIEKEKRRRAILIIEEYTSVTPRNGRYSDDLLRRKTAFEENFFHPSNP